MHTMNLTPTLTSIFLLGYLLFIAVGGKAVLEDQKIIKAVSGHNVTLTCRGPNNNIHIVEWSRADLGKQCVLMQRDGHFVPELQHPSFKNRVDLQDRQMKDGDVSVILKNLTINDDGTYQCRVKTGAKRRSRALLKTVPISIITLRVVVPPGPTGGTTEDGGKKDGGEEDARTEDGGKEDGSVGLIVGLSVPAVLLVVVVVVFLISRTESGFIPASRHL